MGYWINNNYGSVNYILDDKKPKKNFNLLNSNLPHEYPWYCLLLDDVSFSECRIELHTYTNKKQIKVSIIIEKNQTEFI